MTLTALDKPVQFLKGVGPSRADALRKMGLVIARDVVYHVPRRYDDASTVTPIASLEVGMEATAVGRVRSKGVLPTRKGLKIFQAVIQDESGMITVSWPGQPWLDRKIREGDLLLATGTVRFYQGRQLHPREFTTLARDTEAPPRGGLPEGTIFVSYPASEHVPQWVLRRIFARNLDELLPALDEEEYLDADLRDHLGLPGIREALTEMHRPSSLEAVERGRRRLAFDEFFFLQLVQARSRYEQTLASPGIVFGRTNELIRPLHDALGFDLTEAQARVLREIFGDMTSAHRMNRLLQGDVGSGKTVVALFAMLLALESGYQAALMAPTELLAEQHARRLGEMLGGVGVDVALLTGSLSTAERRRVVGGLADGSVPLVVGTHALIQDGVEFRSLGLVVVDEQHRFGVRQRMALGDREPRPDMLIMSATPIPRSTAMALYGDLDLSVLDELPPGRKPVKTLLKRPDARDEVYRFVEKELEGGRQSYVVYPLVEESEKVDLKAATEEYERLAESVFPHRRVGLIHGKLASEEKDRVMRAFAAGEVDVLVATTVIEVGIDVANASVMVVENAERFGLSQLHQLRGRVGRGADESYCILVSQPGEVAGERLKVFRSTSDGFAIAQADLRIRGQGDLFGEAQSGRDPILRFADLILDEDLLFRAQPLARELVDEDPELEHPRNARIRGLLETRWADRLRLFQVG